MPMRWRWPPDRRTPRSPISVSSPSGRSSIRSLQLGALDGLGQPVLSSASSKAMLAPMVSSSSITSWGTTASRRCQAGRLSKMETPPAVIVPADGRWSPSRMSTNVLLPAPLEPTIGDGATARDVEVDAAQHQLVRAVGVGEVEPAHVHVALRHLVGHARGPLLAAGVLLHPVLGDQVRQRRAREADAGHRVDEPDGARQDAGAGRDEDRRAASGCPRTCHRPSAPTASSPTPTMKTISRKYLGISPSNRGA